MNKEQWKPLPGYEDLYLVSDQGRVLGWRYKKLLKQRFVRYGQHGQLMVTVYRAGEKLTTSVAGLVLSAFTGPRPSGMEACHNDGDGTRNVLSNLRWDTHQNNIQDKLAHGTQAKGEGNGSNKLTEQEVLEIAKSLASQVHLAKQFNVTQAAVSSIKTGRNWGWLTGINWTPVGRPRGESHGRSKLREPDVLQIAQSREPSRQVAKDFGVSHTMVKRIRRGKAWGWLTGIAYSPKSTAHINH